MAGEVHHRLGPRPPEEFRQQRTIGDVSLDKLGARIHRRAMSLGEVVDDANLVARVQQFLDTNAADVARPACN